MSENPYSASAIEEPINASNSIHADSLSAIARRTFLAWEKLRVIYVGLLAIITIGMIAGSGKFPWHAAVAVVFGAVVCNLCFFAGPIIETYVVWLGFRQPWPRWLMFISGTFLSAAAAVVTLLGLYF